MQLRKRWWYSVLGGVLFLAGGVLLYCLLSAGGSGQADSTDFGGPGRSDVVALHGMDALNYLPADTDVVVGIAVDKLAGNRDLIDFLARTRPSLEQMAQQFFGFSSWQALEEATGLALRDLDHLVIGLKADPADGSAHWRSVTLVLKTRAPCERNRVLTAHRPGQVLQPNRREGKEWYPLSQPPAWTSVPGIMYFPTDHIVVISDIPDSQIGSLLDLDGKKPALAADVQDVIGRVDDAQVWTVFGGNYLRRQPLPLREAGNVSAGIRKARAAGIWFRALFQDVTVSGAVLCEDGAAAGELAREMERALARLKPRLEAEAADVSPFAVLVFRRLWADVRCDSSGRCARVTGSITLPVLERILR